MMTKKALIALLIATGLLFQIVMSIEVEAQTIEEISKSLICPCGCNKTLDGCYCDTAAKLKSDIEQMIDEGKTKDQIIAEFQANYGDQILVTPPKSGLELTLWTFPIVASIIGTIVIYQLARKKAFIPDSEIKSPIAEAGEDEGPREEEGEIEKYEEYFEKEYRKFKKDLEKEKDQ